jgi:hypothetical protein
MGHLLELLGADLSQMSGPRASAATSAAKGTHLKERLPRLSHTKGRRLPASRSLTSTAAKPRKPGAQQGPLGGAAGEGSVIAALGEPAGAAELCPKDRQQHMPAEIGLGVRLVEAEQHMPAEIGLGVPQFR